MIITRTPFRMSFFGGGSDIEEYFKYKEGSVLSTTFDKYCYVTVRHLPPFFDYTTEVVYSKIERVLNSENICHPVVKNAMKMLNMHNLRIVYDADLPARTGLGTSSSFAVGLLNALHLVNGDYVDKQKIAEEAIYLERVLCCESGGWQDQIAASYGGFNRINFKESGFTVKPVIINPERKKNLNDRLMLFFTGFSRFSSEIQDASKKIDQKINILDKLVSLVDDAEYVLLNENISLDRFGYLLEESWNLKKETGSKVSSPQIDSIYEKAIKAGALGGKLLGAGGGGFLLFYVPMNKQDSVRQAMKDYLFVPFKFENEGTNIIYYSSESISFEAIRRGL